MTTDDEQPGFKDLPVEPGQRWVEIRDDRTTHRLRWEQVPEGSPTPVTPPDSPEQITRTRDLVRDLLLSQAAGRVDHDPPATEEHS